MTLNPPTNISNHHPQRSVRLTTIALAMVLAWLSLSACSVSLAGDVTPPPDYRAPQPQPAATEAILEVTFPSRIPNPLEGAPIYGEKCAPCHGDTGLGDGTQASELPNPVPKIGSVELARGSSPMDWYELITEGRLEQFMPPFSQSLTDMQRWDVLAYVYSLSISSEVVERGGEVYQENCAGCHGEGGQGDGPEVQNLSLSPPDFTDQADMASLSNVDLFEGITTGKLPEMPAYDGQLSENDRWALTAFLRSLTFNLRDFETMQAEIQVEEEVLVESSPSTGENEPETTAGEPPALQTNLGAVRGKVINGSGGGIPADLSIVLHGFDHIQEVITAATGLEEDGSFLFENIDMPEGRIFMVSTEYSQATYTSDIAVAQLDTDALNLPVTIFETTTDTGHLVIDRLHLFIESIGSDTLQVTELYLISNPGDQVVIAENEGQPVVHYSLPDGATNLRFQEGESGRQFVETEDGFGDTRGIPPGMGQYQVMFAYDLPFKKKLEVVRELSIPVSAVVMMMPEMGLKVRSDMLQEETPRDIQGETFRIFTSEGLPAGGQMELTLSGSIRGGGAATLDIGSIGELAAGVLAFGGALALVGVRLFRRESSNGDGEMLEEYETEVEAYPDQESVLDAIIALDDLYTSGELPEKAYRQRRAELKEHLRKMLS